MIVADSIFKINFKFFEPNFINNFKTPKLLEEKEKIITKLELKSKKVVYTNYWFLAFLTFSLFGVTYYFRQQQLYKKRFKELLIYHNSKNNNDKNLDTSNNDISLDIVKDILKNLNRFESQKKYLSQKISLNEVAKSFETNSTYLSRVINLKKGKNFPQYINDLRINYIISELKINSKLRKYTMKAIAEEIGFKSAASFSKTFYRKHKIYPSHFLKELKRSNL